MRLKYLFASLLLVALVVSLTACEVTPAMQRAAERSVRSLIETMPLNAEDIAGALGLEYNPIPFVRLRVEITPRSFTKKAMTIDFSKFPKVKALARFQFIGDFRLFANDRAIISNRTLDLTGEGWINFGFENRTFFIDDIPSVVLKLADRAGECPDIDTIVREPRMVPTGQSYSVSTRVRSNSSGHLAFLVYSNNRCAAPDRAAMKVSVGAPDYGYRAAMSPKPGIAPDTYYGNVMAIQFITRNPGNPLDLNAYDVLFSTGLTMIKIN